MKKAIWITAICVLAVMLFAACSNGADKNIAVNESETVSSSAGNVSSDETVTESAGLSADTKEQNSATALQSTSGSSTKNTPNETAAQQKAINSHSNTQQSQAKSNTEKTKRQTTTQKQTTTKRQTTTQMPAATKKPTTTKKGGVNQSDVQWVQSQAHAYMRSKGIVVDLGVGSYSGRISSVNRTKEELLDEVKEWIDGEYNDCKASGYDTVYMYCKIESRGNGSYFLYVMYG